jgi:hypothetical protein
MATTKSKLKAARARRKKAALRKAGFAIDQIIAGAKALAQAEQSYYGRTPRSQRQYTILMKADDGQ